MGCGGGQDLALFEDHEITIHQPEYDNLELSGTVLLGRPMSAVGDFEEHYCLGTPGNPREACLGGAEQLCYEQFICNYAKLDELLCLIIPLTEEQLFEVLFFIELQYNVSFEHIFLNSDNLVKLVHVTYRDEQETEARPFNLRVKYGNSLVSCYAEYENNKFHYYSPDFDRFIGKHFSLQLVRGISAQEMTQLGFELASSPFWFSVTADSRFVASEQEELVVAVKLLKHSGIFASYCICQSVEGGLAEIMNLANQLMEKLQEEYVSGCKILFLTRKFALFSFHISQFNSFVLHASETVDFDRVEELRLNKVASLQVKYENFNFNLARKRVSDYQSSSVLFDVFPSMKTKVLYYELNEQQRECILSLLDGINKVSIKLSVAELNELIYVIRHEFFELFHIELTYYPEIQVLAAFMKTNQVELSFIKEQVEYFRTCVSLERLNVGQTYDDHRIEAVYRIFKAISAEYSGTLNYYECFDINEITTRSAYFVHFVYSFVCELNGIPAFVVTNASGAAISVLTMDSDGEKVSTFVDLDNRLFLVDESVLPERYQFEYVNATNSHNNVFRKFFFRAKNAVMLEKFIRQLIESADATAGRANAFSSFNASTHEASTHRSLHSSGRIDLFEKQGRWEVRLAVLDEASYDEFIDNFQYCLSRPNGQLALDLRERAFGQIISLEMQFSDPINEYCSSFRGKRGLYLVELEDVERVVADNDGWLCGVESLGQVCLLAIVRKML